jgi:hypothetical protein
VIIVARIAEDMFANGHSIRVVIGPSFQLQRIAEHLRNRDVPPVQRRRVAANTFLRIHDTGNRNAQATHAAAGNG